MTPDIFDALANPVRRALLAQLRGGPQPVKVLAAPFAQGRPAISEHLKVLRAVGLVHEEPRGRERYYHLNAAPLLAVRDWLGAYEQFWSAKMDNLQALLDQEAP